MPTEHHLVIVTLDTTKVAMERLGRVVVQHDVGVYGTWRLGNYVLGRGVSAQVTLRVPQIMLPVCEQREARGLSACWGDGLVRSKTAVSSMSGKRRGRGLWDRDPQFCPFFIHIDVGDLTGLAP